MLLVTPGAAFAAANVLQYGLRVEGAADWLDPLFALPAVAWISTALVLAGPVVTLLLAASLILRLRSDGRAIAVAAISVLVVGTLAAVLATQTLGIWCIALRGGSLRPLPGQELHVCRPPSTGPERP